MEFENSLEDYWGKTKKAAAFGRHEFNVIHSSVSRPQ